MTTAFRTKLFRSVLDCGCNMGLDEFSEEARFEDVEAWLEERGYTLTPFEPAGDPAPRDPVHAH